MSTIGSLSVELKQAFTQLIAKHTGLEIREREQAALVEKILLRIKALKLTPEKYYQLLESPNTDSQQEWQSFIVLLTNIDSSFFRDKDLFSLLKTHIFPELIDRKQNSKTIRICSAGCSSGEEPYSLAILLRELIPNIEQWNLTILGIDINQVALQKAEAGIYSSWSLRNIDEKIQQRYFRMTKSQYHISQEVKQMLNFQVLNLVSDAFYWQSHNLSNFDLILCRNVFIYFENSAIARILDKLYHMLQPLGYLITGHAELYNQNLSQFQTKVFPESIVYQRQTDSLADTPPVLPGKPPYPSIEKPFSEENNTVFESVFEKNNIKMQQATLNLLRQLPPNTRMPKQRNLTAAELILQLETALKVINGETE